MHVDVLIVGAGFGGSLLAQILQQSGKRVLLIEKGMHPRFAMGESTSPLTNLLLETFASRYDLPHLLSMATWGAWKQTLPELGVGLKRGFTYYGHAGDGTEHEAENILAVAASPGDSCADTHWLRSDVDAWLCSKAIELGVIYRDQTKLKDAVSVDTKWECLIDIGAGIEETWTADFLVDAGGRSSTLGPMLGLQQTAFENYPDTVALYSHFDHVGLAASELSLATKESPPYPLDWSALHHVFPGGWMWVLRFDNHRVSAGVSVERWLADAIGLFADGGWERLLERLPSVKAQFKDAVRTLPWMESQALPICLDRCAGQVNGAGWALLPSATAFIDPLYSTGFSLTLLGIERIAAILTSRIPTEVELAKYEHTVMRDIHCVARYIASNFAAFSDFKNFTAVSMFYFAAASWSEICRRIGKPELADGMLLSGNASFWQSFERFKAGECTAEDAIAPWNIAGLADAAKNGMYRADLADVVAAAHKIGMSPDVMRTEVERADWAKC